MPKISNNTVKIHHKDINKFFDVIIMYNRISHFYANIPEEVVNNVKYLTAEERIKFNIKKTRKYRSVKPFISAEKEAECLSTMKECLEVLIDKNIIKRDIIIVFYNPEDNYHYASTNFNNEHEMIGLQFGLTYAVEASVGETKVYSKYKKVKFLHNEERTIRHEMTVNDDYSTVISDTKENRLVLEMLYKNLKILNNKLKEFTSTPDKLIDFIKSDIKLLTNK